MEKSISPPPDPNPDAHAYRALAKRLDHVERALTDLRSQVAGIMKDAQNPEPGPYASAGDGGKDNPPPSPPP